MKHRTILTFFALLLLHPETLFAAQEPQWIWRSQKDRPSPAGERAYLRGKFTLGNKVVKATLEAACAGAMAVYVNGKPAGDSPELRQPLKKDVTSLLQGWGENTVALFGRTTADGIGAVVQIDVETEYGKRQVVVSGADWKISIDGPKGWDQPAFNDAKWEPVVVLGKLGDPPFGNVFKAVSAATPPEEISVPEGFKVELVRTAGPREGSWVCMAIDPKGRLFISPQNAIPESGFARESGWGGIWRATLDETGRIAKWDKVSVPIGACMGMCWAFDSLYLSGQGPEGQAIYRCRDTNGDGDVDAWTLFKKVPGGGGEHGAHGIVKGPDDRLYIIMGNATPPVEGIDPESPCRHYAEDDLLPRIKDPVATFFDGVKSPYGHVLRTDADGKKWELWCVGMRNAYDLDFGSDGGLYTYDSDMEWDLGLPWYRPTRILHLVVGAEFGFREGTSKMPPYYPDTMPAAVDVGLGSPTGVKFGTASNWPAPWKQAFFAMDWTYGRILAIHLQPPGGEGNSAHRVAGKITEFVKGRGLPVTDMEFGPDGAMYFTVGGRGTQGALYRIACTGAAVTPFPAGKGGQSPSGRSRMLGNLEKHFSAPGDAALEAAWENVRMAAEHSEGETAGRALLEAQPVEKWRDMALGLADFRSAHRALLALARCGGPQDREIIADRLITLQAEHLDYSLWEPAAAQGMEDLDLAEMRIWQLILTRHGPPPDSLKQKALKHLSPLFPSKGSRMNRELSQLLVLLQHPAVVAPAQQLMAGAKQRWESSGKPLPDALKLGPQEEMIWFARVLCEVPAGHFSAPQREEYFRWFDETAPQLKGGNNFVKFLEAIRQRALTQLPESLRGQVEKNHQIALAKLTELRTSTPQGVPERKFVRAWTVADLEPDFGKVKAGRNFARAKEIFASQLCLRCHRMGQEGGGVGPDLTAVASRFGSKDILEAIVDPSKVISDQYAALLVETRTENFLGLPAGEDEQTLTIYEDIFGEKKRSIPKADVLKREPAKVSLMPVGLLSPLHRDEVLDLLAYLSAGGRSDAPNFQPAP